MLEHARNAVVVIDAVEKHYQSLNSDLSFSNWWNTHSDDHKTSLVLGILWRDFGKALHKNEEQEIVEL